MSDDIGTGQSIVLETGGQPVLARLDNTRVAMAFNQLLPLTLSLSDFGAGTEKIGDLPTALPVGDAPAGYTPAAGDIAYYAPWGNLAIFLEPFRHADGLVRLGRVEDGFEALQRKGEIAVVIRSE